MIDWLSLRTGAVMITACYMILAPFLFEHMPGWLVLTHLAGYVLIVAFNKQLQRWVT